MWTLLQIGKILLNFFCKMSKHFLFLPQKPVKKVFMRNVVFNLRNRNHSFGWLAAATCSVVARAHHSELYNFQKSEIWKLVKKTSSLYMKCYNLCHQKKTFFFFTNITGKMVLCFRCKFQFLWAADDRWENTYTVLPLLSQWENKRHRGGGGTSWYIFCSTAN